MKVEACIFMRINYYSTTIFLAFGFSAGFCVVAAGLLAVLAPVVAGAWVFGFDGSFTEEVAVFPVAF